jgi:hypothetical protein
MDAPGFRLRAGTAIAILGLAFCLWLLSTRTFSQAWILGLLIVAGWLLRRLGRRPPSPAA